jgi:hypothetical protein
MIRPSIVIHRDALGKMQVLSLTEDAGEALNAYRKAKKPGEVYFICKPSVTKRKNITPDLKKSEVLA